MDISVIIPTYNRAFTIEHAIKSVLNQTYKPIEIIVVDDGSTDNTKRVVESINNPLIKYYYKENGGAASARNYGAIKAEGDWLAFNDSDDVWIEDKLFKQAKYAQLHPEYNLIYSSYKMHMADGNTLIVPDKNTSAQLEGDILSSLVIKNTIGTPTVMVKKDTFLKVGGFDERLRCIEDWNFAIRFAEQYSIGFVDEVTVDAYRVDDSVSSNAAEMFEERCRTIVKYRSLLEQNGKFEVAIMRMFEQAQIANCLEQVKQMFMAFLGG